MGDGIAALHDRPLLAPERTFVELLRMHAVTAVCDVRSAPYSRRNPQFDRETLRETLAVSGIAYAFLGEELGARTKDPACYDREGRVVRRQRSGRCSSGLGKG